MQTRYCDENSVRPSVRPSVTRVYCDKPVERSVQIYTPYERTFSLVFLEEEWLVGSTPSTWNFGSTGPRSSKIANFQPIIARSSSAVTLSEKSSNNTNRKSTTRFPMSLRWSSYVAPKSLKGGLKNTKRPISVKNALRLKKVCYVVSLCKNCQRQSCKAFIGLTKCAKIIFGGRPLVPEILDQSDRVGAKLPIFDLFLLVAPQPLQLCENCQRQCCKAFIGLTIGVKIIGGGDHFYLKFWVKVTALVLNLNNKLR